MSTTTVTVSSLRCIYRLLLLVLVFQLSTLLLVIAGPVLPRLTPATAPTSSTPMPALPPVGFPSSCHPYQIDEQNKDLALSTNALRLDGSPLPRLPFLDRHTDLTVLHRWLRHCHSDV